MPGSACGMWVYGQSCGAGVPAEPGGKEGDGGGGCRGGDQLSE